MATKTVVKKDEDPNIITVFGLQGIASLVRSECVINTVDEGDSLLLTVKLGDRVHRVRVLSTRKDIGMVVPDKIIYEV